MDSFFAFAAISILIIVTPGPDTAITIRNTMLGGMGCGLFTVLGIVTGQIWWACAASFGLTILLTTWASIFLLLKSAGAVYLVYLGISSMVAAFERQGGTSAGMQPAPGIAKSRGASFRQGLFSNLGNPKMLIFFASMLPPFVQVGTHMLLRSLVFSLIFSVITFLWLSLLTTVIEKAGARLWQTSARRIVECVTGIALVGLGMRILAWRD